MYVLITPAKNEEKNLPKVITHVLNQEMKPKLWVIVDDNSGDNTDKIIKKYSRNYQWIKYYKLVRKENKYDTEFGYSRVVKKGIEIARKLTKTEKNNYKYIGILDADIILKKDYFYKLVKIAEKTKRCGIISGLLHLKDEKDSKNGSPRGGARLYDIKCLEEMGGYPISAAPDTVTNLKAENRDWKLLKTPKTFGKQLRPPRSGKGLWEGYKMKAKGRYYLNYHPINALLTSCYFLFRHPFYIGLAYFYGYFSSYLKNNPQTNDKEVIHHFYHERFNHLKKKLKIKR